MFCDFILLYFTYIYFMLYPRSSILMMHNTIVLFWLSIDIDCNFKQTVLIQDFVRKRRSTFSKGAWLRFWLVLFSYFYCKWCFSNAFLMINQNCDSDSDSGVFKSKTQSSEFCVM